MLFGNKWSSNCRSFPSPSSEKCTIISMAFVLNGTA